MEIFLKNRSDTVDARAIFDPTTGIVIVKAGSIISKELSNAPTFRSRKAMSKKREGVVLDGVLQKDIMFTSLSTSATFVVGSNRDGWKAWRNAEGKSMAEVFDR